MKTPRPASFDALVSVCLPGRRYDQLRAALLQWARYLLSPKDDPAFARLTYDLAHSMLSKVAEAEGNGQVYDLLRAAIADLGQRPDWLPPTMACGHRVESWEGTNCAECVSAARPS